MRLFTKDELYEWEKIDRQEYISCKGCGRTIENPRYKQIKECYLTLSLPIDKVELALEKMCNKCKEKYYKQLEREREKEINKAKEIRCDFCGGDGRLWRSGTFRWYYRTCPKCYGEGKYKIIDDEVTLKERALENTNFNSPCFITTACVRSRGLSDDCIELVTLREFRDNILLKDKKTAREVDEYYKIAPQIVNVINSLEYADRIWDKIYQEVLKAVKYVKSKEFDKAYQHYKQTILKLKKKFL